MLKDAFVDTLIRSESLDITRRCVTISIVRLRHPTPVQTRALGELFHCEWPAIPNTAAGSPDSVLWLSPHEWAVTGVDPEIVVTNVARACGATLHQVSDMSSGYALFEISGAHARSVMAKSCSLDFHPRKFSSGRCAQTIFAQVAALIHQPGAEPRYCVYAEESLTHYLRTWLSDAAVGTAETMSTAVSTARPEPTRLGRADLIG